ncbi:MAG: 1-acyl-sn-glycerol-3-phosphate acyltransferase [Candidatus Improbicoccus pseudotrichonymphae]|uniref:1-acyl-sn-glycerol-3-phosphate acyltransferase n=1 Tax=Candidatus Improbicoccus pseudotrichonymphae TaxID=3033792 RepID=A0AA48HUR4_9FIRM|nr:MAG: 1-acyl-sn-glycerol-3-phosphate acyltransferase [Candidatus Improbicoccus pseudotrichonymphae]
MFYFFIVQLLNIFIRICFPFEVKGLENIENIDGDFILCSNHLSNVDPLFFIVINFKIHRQKIYFLAKKSIFKNFFINCILDNMGAIPIDRRGVNNEKSLKRAENALRNKNSIGIFIEGTRSKTGKFLRPHSGAAFLAARTKSKVLPVCITPLHSHKVKIFRKTLISFGSPMLVLQDENPTIKEIKQVTVEIMRRIMDLRNLK